MKWLRSWLLSLIEARDEIAKTHDNSQECYDSCHAPPEYTRILLMAEIKHKLPKPGHFGLAHALCKHCIRSLDFLRA
jgi:hypothetical protein